MARKKTLTKNALESLITDTVTTTQSRSTSELNKHPEIRAAIVSVLELGTEMLLDGRLTKALDAKQIHTLVKAQTDKLTVGAHSFRMWLMNDEQLRPLYTKMRNV